MSRETFDNIGATFTVILFFVLVIATSYSIGNWNGWDSGVKFQKEQNCYSVWFTYKLLFPSIMKDENAKRLAKELMKGCEDKTPKLFKDDFKL